jgi:hypothetical protein
VRHAEGLDHVFDRHAALERVGKRRLAPFGREEVVEFGVKAKMGGGHTQISQCRNRY